MRDGLADLGAERVRGADTGRATGVAAAGGEVLTGAIEEWACALEEALRESDPAGRHVEEVDGRPLGVRRAHFDRETEVVRTCFESSATRALVTGFLAR